MNVCIKFNINPSHMYAELYQSGPIRPEPIPKAYAAKTTVWSSIFDIHIYIYLQRVSKV